MTTEDLESMEPTPAWRWAWLSIGLAVFAAILFAPTPDGLRPEAQRLAAVTALMSIWWVSQPLPIPITSFLPLALYPLLGILSAQQTSRAYGDQNVFLYLGGFVLALGI